MKTTKSTDSKLKDFAHYAKPGDELGGIVGALLNLIAGILFIIGIVALIIIAFAALIAIDEFRRTAVRYGILVAGLIGALSGIFLDLFRRHFVSIFLSPRSPLYVVVMAASLVVKAIGQRFGRDYQRMLNEDTRKPILYLRRFKSDTSFGLTNSDLRSSEQVLVSIFEDKGPVIAVGKPDESIPLLGSIRLYFKDEEWKEKVAALISLSSLVIIQPDHSKAIEFELLTLMTLKKDSPQQILFSFLGWQNLHTRRETYNRFKIVFERISGIRLPPWMNGAYFLYFTSNWEPVFAFPNKLGKHKLWKNTTDPKVLSALLPFFNSMH